MSDMLYVFGKPLKKYWNGILIEITVNVDKTCLKLDDFVFVAQPIPLKL